MRMTFALASLHPLLRGDLSYLAPPTTTNPKCTLSDGNTMTLSRARNTDLTLAQLQHSSTLGRKYLPTIKSANHIFLFHATTAPRHVFGVFYPNRQDPRCR